MKTKRNKGILFIVSGPSGVGKGTILNRVFQSDGNLIFSVSATTRSPRPGEVHGRDYFFVTEEEFLNMVESHSLLEHAHVHGNYYGTPEEYINQKMEEGFDVFLDIDVQGAIQVMKKRPDGVFVFVAPPRLDHNILLERLAGRNTEKPEQIKKRIERAKEELKSVHEYEYVIFNDKVEEAVKDMESIIRANRCKTGYNNLKKIN